MHKAVDEMASRATFRGYGPGRLRFLPRPSPGPISSAGDQIEADEIIVSDGAKCDLRQHQVLFATS
jgi:LL-diaminopimelate aminotransferase